MSIRERLVSLDRKALGAAYDADNSRAVAPWVKVVAFSTPVVAGCAIFAVSFIDLGAAVGIPIGMLFAFPIGLIARESGRFSSR